MLLELLSSRRIVIAILYLKLPVVDRTSRRAYPLIPLKPSSIQQLLVKEGTLNRGEENGHRYERSGAEYRPYSI
jgi:hypothetical protein